MVVSCNSSLFSSNFYGSLTLNSPPNHSTGQLVILQRCRQLSCRGRVHLVSIAATPLLDRPRSNAHSFVPTGDSIYAYKFGIVNGKPQFTLAGKTVQTFGGKGAPRITTLNGQAGTAIVSLLLPTADVCSSDVLPPAVAFRCESRRRCLQCDTRWQRGLAALHLPRYRPPE